MFLAYSAGSFGGEFAKPWEVGRVREGGWLIQYGGLNTRYGSTRSPKIRLHYWLPCFGTVSVLRRWSIIKSPCSLSCQETRL